MMVGQGSEAVSSDITTPTKLVAEFKKSGEFDRLRRELLSEFRNGEGINNFMSRVEEIVHQRMSTDSGLRYMGPDAAHAELMQEMDRYPLVERAVADMPALTNPRFRAGIQKSLKKLLKMEVQSDSSSESEDSDSESSDGEPASSRAPSPAMNGPQKDQPNGKVAGDDAEEDEVPHVEKPEAPESTTERITQLEQVVNGVQNESPSQDIEMRSSPVQTEEKQREKQSLQSESEGQSVND